MTYQSIGFDLDYIDPWFFLGLNKDMYIEVYPTTNRKSLVNWEVDIEDRSFGIMRINSNVLDVRLYLTIEIILDECSDLMQQYLDATYECEFTSHYAYVYLTPEKLNKFKIINEMAWKYDGLFVTDVLVDFMDKQIIIR